MSCDTLVSHEFYCHELTCAFSNGEVIVLILHFLHCRVTLEHIGLVVRMSVSGYRG